MFKNRIFQRLIAKFGGPQDRNVIAQVAVSAANGGLGVQKIKIESCKDGIKGVRFDSYG